MELSQSKNGSTNSSSFPYRLAAIDLDGTLLGPDSKIALANLEAVRRLQQAGVTVILASGRQHESIMRYQNELSLTGPVVSCQGALVIDPQTDRVILLNPLTNAVAAKTVAEAEKHGATVFYYHSKGIFAQKANQWTAMYERLTGRQLNWVETFDSINEGTTYKLIWMHSEDKISAIEELFRLQADDNLYVVRTMPEALEFLSPQANKAIGLEAVAKALNIPRNATVSFGDADNDIPMLLWSGLGVSMSHATKGAKAAAQLQAPEGKPETSFARAVDAVFRHYA